jgi:putative ABC transport system permease protein
VGYLGLARSARAAPASALPLLVLVLAVAVGGFVAAVQSSITAARDTGARQAVGADVRLRGDLLTEAAVPAVAEVPGVTAVAAASRDGFVGMGAGFDVNIAVITVDAAQYQRVLAEIGWPVRLPAELLAASPGADPLPVLTWQPVDEELTLLIDRVEYPAVSVGEVTGLPRLHTGRSWVLVPRQALARPPPIDELLIGGVGADPAQLRQAVAAEVEVTTLAEQRTELARSGFNRGLSALFVAGLVAALLGGLLAVGLSLVVPAAARGRTLSLLRTMGLSASQARGLLLVEVMPVTTLAVAAGAVAGAVMPALLAPALGLTEFTGGTPVPVAVDLPAVGLLAGLLATFVVGGVLAEAAVNRRLGLGQVLRV